MDSLLLSARDMSDEENVKDAAFELDRCHDAESYKRWCERWARALIAVAGARSPRVYEMELSAEEAWNEQGSCEKISEQKTSAIEDALTVLNGVIETLGRAAEL